MGCSPVHSVPRKKHRRASIIDLQNSPIRNNRANARLSKEILIIEDKNDPFKIYNNLEFIKEGNYGTLYKVQHKQNKNIRLMKMLNLAKMKDSAFTKNDMINQIELLKNLFHPNIIQLFEVFYNKDKIYMIYEYCQEGDLFEYICKTHAFNEVTCKEILKQLLSALKYCHQKGVIHSDLCPEHIVIMNDDSNKIWVKIIDFGAFNLLSYNKQILTSGFRHSSNPYYVCPEPVYSDKSDIWSVGIIMYFLLSGEIPFQGSKPDDIKQKILHSNHIDFSGKNWTTISHVSKRFIEKLLSKNVSDRPNAEEALNDVFFTTNYFIDDKANSTDAFQNIIDNVRQFNRECKIKEGLHGFIVHHLIKNEDLNQIRQCFEALDKDKNGMLSREELIVGLKNVMTPNEAEDEADKIISNLDVSNDCIKYDDFIKASINKDKLISEQNLKMLFTLMDTDKSGKISKEELKNFFVGNTNNNMKESIDTKDDDLYAKFIAGMDINGDMEINFSAFKKIMYNCK